MDIQNIKHSVHVVLFKDDTNTEILCVSRKDNHKDFGLPGGKVDPGETNEEALIREVKEETGLKIKNLYKVLSMHKDGYMGHTYISDWEGEINTDEPHIIKWDTFEEVKKGTFGKWNQLVEDSLKDMKVI